MTSSIALSGCSATGLFKTMVQHRLGMHGRPLVRQHFIESRIVGVQAQQQFAQIGPRFNPMTLGAREDREQDSRSWPGLLAAEEQPVLSTDGLMTERPLADVVVD